MSSPEIERALSARTEEEIAASKRELAALDQTDPEVLDAGEQLEHMLVELRRERVLAVRHELGVD